MGEFTVCMWPHLNTEHEIKSHSLEEGSKKFRCLNRYSMRCSAKQPNKYVQYSFYIPQPGSFLWHMQLCGVLGDSVWPLWFSAAPFFPTHWQPLDLESTAVIVIYALSHDRCAHIVLSIRPRRLKVTARSGFNHCIFSPPKKWSCHHTSPSIGLDHEGLLLHAVAGRIPSLRSFVPRKKAILCQRNIRLECNHRLEAILS